jgi:site-specific recombinase XerD
VFWCDSVKIEVDNSLYLEVLRREFVLRKYSRKTVKMYLHYNQDFLGYVGKDPTEVTNTDIKNYLYHVVGQKNVSASTLNTVISALKFYYGDILKRDFVYDIKRPKKDKKLSVVLSQEEVSKILSSISNIKHKAILMLIYSSGLRVGEIVKLRVVDIDFERKLIHIKDAKGRKNRYTILSDKAAEILREYLREYKPVNWLFHGMNPGKYITLRTV